MFKLDIQIGNFIIDLSIGFKESDKRKKKQKEENADTSADVQLSFFDEEEALIEYGNDIREMAKRFESDIKTQGNIYQIPDSSDIPPNYHISSDIEIITDKFEKEVEDIIEGRR